MMVSIHGPDDSEFDFRTAMNIWGKLRKRHILVEKAKESTEKSKLFTRNRNKNNTKNTLYFQFYGTTCYSN
jgi:hypothetical protein